MGLVGDFCKQTGGSVVKFGGTKFVKDNPYHDEQGKFTSGVGVSEPTSNFFSKPKINYGGGGWPGKEITVNIQDLHPSQDTVSMTVVEGYVGKTGVPPPDVFQKKDGRLVVVDGHHRIVAAILEGKTTIKANVFTAEDAQE